jgi:hypothetical protein
MQQLPNDNTRATEAQLELKSIVGVPVRLADIVQGQFADKRRMGIHPDRLVEALAKDYPDLAGWIKESGEYIVIMAAVGLAQAKEQDGYLGQPLGVAFQHTYGMSHMAMGPGFSIAVFSGVAGEGVLFTLHPRYYQGVNNLGEGGILNLALDLLTQGTINRSVGFSRGNTL